MAIKVKLSKILEALELPEEMLAFLDPETGEVFWIPEDAWNKAEWVDLDLDDLSEWERNDVMKAIEVQDSDRYLSLPGQFEINEWRMMRDFVYTLGDPERSELLDAIHGRGAFRIFKSTANRLGLLDDWFKYRNDAYKQIAINWLEENELDYIENE